MIRPRKAFAYWATKPPLSLIPFRWLKPAAQSNLVILVYHAVSDSVPAHLKHLYYVRSVKQFRDDLDFFERHFVPAGVDELRAVIRGERLSSPHFIVSFDDGLREVYDVAAPVLSERNLTAMIFVNPAFVGNVDVMYRLKASLLNDMLGSADADPMSVGYADRHRLDDMARDITDLDRYRADAKPYMNMTQLRHLAANGFIIGAHSVDHPHYSALSLTEQVQQTRESMNFVVDYFKPQLNLFAFPFTDDRITTAFFSEIMDGSPPVIDATFGAVGMKRDSFARNLQRVPMENYTGSASSIIRYEMMASRLRGALGTNTIHRS